MKKPCLTLLSCAAAWTMAYPAAVQAQAGDPVFLSYDTSPFGPGDRSMKLSVQLGPGETNANTELWVVYGENRSEVASAGLAGSGARGRLPLETVNSEGVASGTFVFPHTDNSTPNQIDANGLAIRSGRTVHYKLIKKRGAATAASPVVTFIMPDKLTIANVGDSYASGEGSPYASGPKWDSTLCHRSGNSGQARAVRNLKSEYPNLAIAFKNVACSGAQVAEGILLSQKKATWFGESEDLQEVVKPQIAAVGDWLAANGYAELNIAMVSGGGNDVNFGLFIEKFLVLPFEFRAGSTEFNNLRETISNDVPQLYNSLRQEFDRRFTYDRVLVSEYPDPMRGADGQFCDAEFSAMNSAFLIPLNSTIRNTVSGFPKFGYVGGTMAETRTHGLCNADQPYFNNGLVESLWVQGDIYGIVHPNVRGHRESYQPLYLPQLREAVRDIQIKWAKIKAKEEMRAKAAAEQRQSRLRLVAIKDSKPLAGVVRIAPPIQIEPAQRAELAKAVAAATVQAKGRSMPTVKAPDNRMPDDEG